MGVADEDVAGLDSEPSHQLQGSLYTSFGERPRGAIRIEVGEASLGLLTNGYITGVTLFVDGGERLI